jgi:ubiquitin-protein ligase
MYFEPFSGAGTMKTKMFHPNISKSGEICVDTLKKAWTKNLGIADVLVVSLSSNLEDVAWKLIELI